MQNYSRFFLALLFTVIPLGQANASSPESPQSQSITCPTTSSNSYSQGGMNQWDFDNPVRPAANHADKNLALRSYDLVNQTKGFVQYGSDDPQQPPQFATLFNPDRTPTFSNTYQAHNWNWQNPPATGTRGSLISNTPWPVTVLGLQTTPGEVLQAPTHARNLGSPWGTGGSVVIFADDDSITLHFTREDSAATGYTVHIDNICVDPNLRNAYNSLENSTRNTFYPPARDGDLEYNLVGLTQGQAFGVARGSEIRVAIVDTGTFMDPRSRDEWWQIRPAAPTQTALANSVLPTSRSVTVGTTATIYHTVINGGSVTADNITLSMANPPAGTFTYQQSNCANNQLTGPMNPTLSLAAGGTLCYVLSFTPSAAFNATDVHIQAQATNSPATTLLSGINTWLLRATNTAGPDMVALTTTTDFHQVACNGTQNFAVAIANVGAAVSLVTATADTGSASLPLSILLRETNPATGAIIGDDTLENVAAGQNRSVLITVTFNGCISFNAATNRIFIRFRDGSNNIVGSTSTAVSTNR